MQTVIISVLYESLVKKNNFKKNIVVFLLVTFFCLGANFSIGADEKDDLQSRGIIKGMAKDDFLRIYPKNQARTYRWNDSQEWLTFNEPMDGDPKDIVTFHIQDEKISGWSFNDRPEVIKEYLSEFCSMAIIHGMPKIYEAIVDTFKKVPFDVFLQITDRRRPVLFTEYYDSGTARFANSSEMISRPDDAPAFEEGMTLIKLGVALEGAETPDAIEGVIAHELAHRVLEHSQKGNFTCTAEREANALIKKWGFEEEFAQASKVFGHQAGDSASCQEK